MNYIVTDERVDTILYFIRLTIINICTFYIFLKLKNIPKLKLENAFEVIAIILISLIGTGIKNISNSINSIIVTSSLLIVTLSKVTKSSIGYVIATAMVSICIGNILFFVSVGINSIPNVFFNIQNDLYALICIISIYIVLVLVVMKINRLKKGFSFLNGENNNQLFDVLMLNISAIILFFLGVLGNYNVLIADNMGICIIVLSAIMFLSIKKSFQVYYKQKLLYQQLKEANDEIKVKDGEIDKLEKENLGFSKRCHSLAHKQKSLEYKINQMILNNELAEELDVKDRIEKLSKEMYERPVEELEKTGIVEIDDMLSFMQSECIKENIEFNLQVLENVHHIINNIINRDKLEILIADHIKDAIIAIKHCDNVNRSILVKLGKVDESYGLWIYDSGIEFEEETLRNLGKIPSTTHKDEGGTGMGFMNTFDTLRECKGSLIIKRIGKPSKDNFTKIVIIKFDGENQFNII